MTGVVLFAGGGLACHGLVEAGLDLELGVEWEADAVKVAQATGLAHVIEGDVRDAELRQRVERPGLLWSSFPCQAWSTAGKRQGAKDERNGWPWTVDWIDAVSPRWFIAENVRGLTFHRGDADCDAGARPKPDDCPRCYLDGVILPQLRERFEWVDCRVLNSADFGTPQHRRRLFVVAGPRRISWPAPTHSEGGDLWTQRWRSMGEALGLTGCTVDTARNSAANPNKEIPVDVDREPCSTVGTKGNQYVQPVAAIMQRGRDGGTRDERRSLGEPSVTMTAEQIGNRGPWIELRRPAPTQASTAGHGCGQISADAATRCRIEAEFQAVTGRRRLTVEECRVLMNAPQCYDAALDLVTKTAAYRILGNGVDRQVSRLLAQAVLDADKESP
jgi:DNA-cytosine methyltransferase